MDTTRTNTTVNQQLSSQRTVSVVFPVFNEEGNLLQLHSEVTSALTSSGVSYELVFVDNGSTDGSLELIRQLCAKDTGATFISLSRNFGHQNAIVAGMSFATGDAVVTMDADLQHPPDLVPEMISMWKAGTDVVYTTKRNANLPVMRRWIVKSFYSIMSKVSGVQLEFGQSDFRLLDRAVANVILQMSEYHKFLRGQVQWVGFKQQGLSYDVRERFAGESKFSYSDLFAFALDGIVSFSRYPLRLVTWIGLVVSTISCSYVLWILAVWACKALGFAYQAHLPPGWVTLTVGILFLGSVQLIAIGVLGEYVGRIFDQTKGRPNFIVREYDINRQAVVDAPDHIVSV